MAYMPDDLRIFPDLTCEENLEIARRLSEAQRLLEPAAGGGALPGPGRPPQADGHLISGGEKKMLGMGRALMANPDMILLDEPSEGLAPLVVANLAAGDRRRSGTRASPSCWPTRTSSSAAGCASGATSWKKAVSSTRTRIEAIWDDEAVIKKYLADLTAADLRGSSKRSSDGASGKGEIDGTRYV